MIFSHSDSRTPLAAGTVVEMEDGDRYVIDALAGSGGFALTYIAHTEGSSSRYVALKELFPQELTDAVAERGGDGRIVLRNPFADRDGGDELWAELRALFEREVELARRANTVTDRSGSAIPQNNPDVLNVEGPLRDTKGNTYLVVATYFGEPLKAFIDEGRQDGAKLLQNHNLPEVIEILGKVATHLADLHAGAQIYHLDLSPVNIYVTRQYGATELHPYIIDYGSAYDFSDASLAAAHRYTRNPFSAPEIRALAELNDPDCGYRADRSSDTYSLAAILFYAVLGSTYTPETGFGREWQTKIRELYPPEIYRDFADKLIAFFKKGLSPVQRERFATADDLARGLGALARALEHKGILGEMDGYLLASFAALDRYPLFDYADESGEINVLCLGSGDVADTMLRTASWCGQMLGRRLRFHVVSRSAQALRDRLLTEAPELAGYSNLGENPTEIYAEYFFENIPDLRRPEVLDDILRRYASCRCVVVALGENRLNVELAERLTDALAQRDGERYVVHYALEGVTQNVRLSIPGERRRNVDVNPFGSRLASNRRFAAELGERAFRINYLYDKLSRPSVSRVPSMEGFLRGRSNSYNRESSAAAALHIRYKLASVGIDLRRVSDAELIGEYTSGVLGEDGAERRNALLALEHRRWMMYMIMQGYRLADMKLADSFGFRNGNLRFRDETNKLHPCIVPCDTRGTRLAELSPDEWDGFASFDEIDSTDFDPLDRVSLKLHLLAKHKMGDAAPRVEVMLDSLGRALRFLPDDESARERVERALETFVSRVRSIMDGAAELSDRYFSELAAAFDDFGVDVGDDLAFIKNELRIFAEYYSRRDYKAADSTIVEYLPWILCAPDDLDVVKLTSGDSVDNIASALLLEPKRVIYFGRGDMTNVRAFFAERGSSTELLTVPCASGDYEVVKQQLRQVVRGCGRNTVIDVTGADAVSVAAAIAISAEGPEMPVVTYDYASGGVESVRGSFLYAPIYRFSSGLSAAEAYLLYGAREREDEDERYMMRLRGYIPALWEYYLRHKDRWQLLMAFFARFGRAYSPLYFTIPEPDALTLWTERRYAVDVTLFRNTRMKKVLDTLHGGGVIRNLRYADEAPERLMELCFECPKNAVTAFDKFFAPERTSTQNRYPLENTPYVCTIRREAGGLTVSVDAQELIRVQTGVTAEFEDRATGAVYRAKDVFPMLEDLQSLGLISMLDIDEKDDFNRPGSNYYHVSFVFRNTAIRDCFEKAGNILEAYVWHEAMQLGCFDDVAPNFHFSWGESGVENELDVILTKGLSTIVISCKTAKFNKEHLYEVKYLTDRFSVNSKAVIIYTSDAAVEDGKIVLSTEAVENRARSMQVYLIGFDILREGKLGETLLKIANGEIQPSEL